MHIIYEFLTLSLNIDLFFILKHFGLHNVDETINVRRSSHLHYNGQALYKDC